ncbi:hypothetical protein AXG93_4027s1160 [Marchantia polymorpha subsp. ruderalis]|uniref:Protein SDA1 n=1 Tax=Marchantia polymorpha subsp. ruderalis TaxID=1480154 RepID=A0A176W5T8_MARPO|nr:hypothetical protein AXG93_4027s1160 [Marchantia polymorpha subsp. ruderalis]
MGGITAASGGRNIDNGDLLSLQARMKKDPPGYEEELLLQLRHFDACISILLLQAPVQAPTGPTPAGESGPAKEVADVAMFLAHMAPFYPQHLKELPQKLLQKVELTQILPILIDLQCVGDRVLRKLAFLHIIHDIRRTNLKHKNEQFNRSAQNLLFNILKGDEEVKAKRALVVLAELHRRKVWTDERTADAICSACLHKSPRIMIASLRFLLGYDQEKEDQEEDESSDEEEDPAKLSVNVDRESIYKAYHKGTVSSKRKKQAKLQRVIRSMKKQQRTHSREMEQGSHAPLQHVVDPQVKLMMMQLISRTVGIHRLILLNFYPFLQRYIEPHQRDVTLVLAAAVQACHDLVPPDAIEPVIRQLVNHFVHDRARPEVIAVGLNVVREICMRVPLIMTPELLQDLALYKKNREKAVAAAARSVIAVYRELMPSMLGKKDRGRNADLAAKPKAFGEVSVATGVPGAELLLEDTESENEDGEGSEDEEEDDDDDDEGVLTLEEEESGDEQVTSDLDGEEGEDEDDEDDDEEGDDEDDEGVELTGEETPVRAKKKRKVEGQETPGTPGTPMTPGTPGTPVTPSTGQSLRNLRKQAVSKSIDTSEIKSKDGDGILSNEDYEKIRVMKSKRAAKEALSDHGLTKAGKKRKETSVKLTNPDNLSGRRVDPAVLEAHVKRRMEKEERVAMVKAGREDRTPYSSRTATKQKKTGGMSNKQKNKRKALPLAAVRSKVARNAEMKRMKGRGKNQFRGKKAWKS